MAPDLRPYQEKAVVNTLACFERGDESVLTVMPTGTGKTYAFMGLAKIVADEYQGRTLIIAHRSELLEQASEAATAFGLKWEIEKAQQRARHASMFGRADVVIASVQSMQGGRLAQWPKNHFKLIVCDEAHHVPSPSYQNTLGHFEGYWHLGVTATPERGDGSKLGSVYPVLAFEYPLRQAIEEGYLVRPIFERPTTSIDLSRIRTTKGDLNRGDLEDEISLHIEELVNALRERIGDRQTIIFTPDVDSAIAFGAGLRGVGVEARSVHGKSPDRVSIARQFKAGDFQAVANAMLWVEGFDAPIVSAIGLARPTKSGVLFRQQVGRGLRLYDGKSNCIIVDFACNSGQHDLVTPIELFDTTGMDSEVLKIADDLVKQGRERDPLRAIEKAEQIHKERLVLRVSVRERASRYKFIAYDPFEIGNLLGVPKRKAQANSRPLERWQKKVLEAFKLASDGMTARQADRLIAELRSRQKQGLATHRQVACLVANGIDLTDARTFTFEEASSKLDELIGSRQHA